MNDTLPEEADHQVATEGSGDLAASSSAVRAGRIRRNLVVALVSVLALASVGLLRFAAHSMVPDVNLQRARIESVVGEYMRAMELGDAPRAYEQFSSRAQRQVTLEDVNKLLQGNAIVLFDGYQSARIDTIRVSTLVSTNPDLAQGIVAQVSGTIVYEDGIQGTFDAVLERTGGQWRLHNIRVTTPPEKALPGPEAKWPRPTTRQAMSRVSWTA